ncbi:SLAC1 anion channel family protein [Helicobacter sp. 11S03491-1]|uniref:SLAC1 anion channel family protein n=1 Tax=Helicobacter sp. 11S03491-1 TaxID=1476196 RepID=UPI000BA751E5|nr:SLAC1 anion channel family protein [Helicobacter sp. 11S03491-1]PAF43838.1 C4-dicarboxylate ABC transporter [Helicobacter sp. 11S03491-1]
MLQEKGYFSYLPISLFGSVMGLSGLSVAWELASQLYGITLIVSQVVGWIAILAFVILAIAYGLKIITNFDSFCSEFKNPILKGFFGTFIISLLLLPMVIYHYSPLIAMIMWIIGVILMLLFAWHMVSFWICSKQEQGHVTPAWIIPVVGTLDIPLASHLFGFYQRVYYLNVLALCIGLFFALPIITLILSRILLVDKLPNKLMPTLMILVAPFSVGFSAYLNIVGEIDLFALSLFFLGLFIFLVLLPQYMTIIKCCPFRITWWAVSFPLSALGVSMLRVVKEFDSPYLHFLVLSYLIVFTLLMLCLITRTLKGIFNGELRELS